MVLNVIVLLVIMMITILLSAIVLNMILVIVIMLMVVTLNFIMLIDVMVAASSHPTVLLSTALTQSYIND